MELFKQDFLIELEEKDDLKEAFLLCAENKLVLPFIPIFQSDCKNFFTFSFFTEEIFDLPSSHYIAGFEILLKGKKIKYGGKVHITNTGLNLKSIFFSFGLRKILGKQNPIDISENDFTIKKIFIKLISKSYIIYGESKPEKLREIEEKIKVYPKYIFKTRDDLFFIIPSRYKIYEKYLTLPEDFLIILEKIPYKSIHSLGEKKYKSIEDFLNESKQTKNFILVKQKNYLISLYPND